MTHSLTTTLTQVGQWGMRGGGEGGGVATTKLSPSSRRCGCGGIVDHNICLSPPSCYRDGDDCRSDKGGCGVAPKFKGGCGFDSKFQSIQDTKPSSNSSNITIKSFTGRSRPGGGLPKHGPKSISTQVEKKEPINSVESIAVLESGNNLLSCTSVLTPGSTQVQKKASLNPVESIVVMESGNNLLSCTSVLTSGCRTIGFFPH